MFNHNNFLLICSSEIPENDLFKIDQSLFSNYYPVFSRNHFCFYHGNIHNSSELSALATESQEPFEKVLIELFLKNKKEFPMLLKGNFSLVIGNKDHFYLLRDGNGYENLYYLLRPSEKISFMVSNSIKEIAKYQKLEVNEDILPEYFLKTDINSGATFFKGIKTLAFFEFASFDRKTHNTEKKYYDDFFTGKDTISRVNINEVIVECDNLIEKIIMEKYDQLYQNFNIITSFSGGTDSSCIQYFLNKRNANVAYTANFIKSGEDYAYARDVAAFLNLKHKTIHSDTAYLAESLKPGIFLSEKPYLFAGESLLFHMYQEAGKDFKAPVACFDGTGAEGILGASRILYELRLIRKYRKIFRFILPFIKAGSKKLYKRYKEFYTFVNSRNIPDNFILRYFTDEKLREPVKIAFGLPNLDGIDDFEISMMKTYNTTLFESVYRFLAFELEYKRVNNMRLQLAKGNNITLVFPFTETDFFKYLIQFDTEIKLRNAKTKYIFRKALEKKFSKNIVYRKKVRKNVSVFEDILQDEKIKEIIKEIKNRRYTYFNFNYDEVFNSPIYSSLAYKLINFHVWHKLFIDPVKNQEKAPKNTQLQA